MDRHLEALGDPEVDDSDTDFAGEHDTTAVEEDITEGRGPGEQESPRGWDGMDGDGAP